LRQSFFQKNLFKSYFLLIFMVCKQCSIKPVIQLSNSPVSLCKQCFFQYFEKKVFKTISKHNLIEVDERIGVAVSGGKDSFSALYLVQRYLSRRKNFSIVVIAIDEGISSYRDLSFLEKYCSEEGLELHIVSFESVFGFTLDEALSKHNIKPCTLCGVLRRYILNRTAQKLKLDKLITGHNLDDEAQSVLMNQFKGNLYLSARLGPLTGVIRNDKFIRRAKPLYFLSEKETATYAFLRGFPIPSGECPNYTNSFRNDVRNLLNNLESSYPGTKHAVINSFLLQLPILKDRYRNEQVQVCTYCGEICSGLVCKACELLERIRPKTLN